MSNSTAAGPPRGLLDILFGSKVPEEAAADGQGFNGLMSLISSLSEKKDPEEQGTNASRTLRETLAGKGVAERGPAGTPVMFGAELDPGSRRAEPVEGREVAERREKLTRLALLAGLPAQPAVSQPSQAPELQAPAEALEARQVNQSLLQKGLPPLTPEETKLLQDVNGKAVQAGLAQSAVGLPREPSPGPAMHKAIAAKGVEPRQLKEGETTLPPVSGAPERMLSTETYLRMHEAVSAKGPVKDPAMRAAQAAGTEQAASPARAPEALTAAALAGVAQKGGGEEPRTGEKADLPESGPGRTRLDQVAGGAFGAELGGRVEPGRHDIYLPGPDKPEQMRGALIAELGNSVALHAHRGGGEMRLVIHPDDMGEVKLKVATRNGKVEVEVTADNEKTAELIRGGARELEASLRNQSLSLAKFEVSVGDSAAVTSAEARPSLSEQFLSQGQEQHSTGFQQSSSESGRGARWDGGHGGRQDAPYAAAEEQGRSAPRAAASVPRAAAGAISGSRRLDVVA